jgi:hypothetical protein
MLGGKICSNQIALHLFVKAQFIYKSLPWNIYEGEDVHLFLPLATTKMANVPLDFLLTNISFH